MSHVVITIERESARTADHGERPAYFFNRARFFVALKFNRKLNGKICHGFATMSSLSGSYSSTSANVSKRGLIVGAR